MKANVTVIEDFFVTLQGKCWRRQFGVRRLPRTLSASVCWWGQVSLNSEAMWSQRQVFLWKSQSVLIQRFPVHLVPEPWTIYLGKKGAARGLFFMDGEDWWEKLIEIKDNCFQPNIFKYFRWSARTRLNPLFLRATSLQKMQEHVKAGFCLTWLLASQKVLNRQLFGRLYTASAILICSLAARGWEVAWRLGHRTSWPAWGRSIPLECRWADLSSCDLFKRRCRALSF